MERWEWRCTCFEMLQCLRAPVFTHSLNCASIQVRFHFHTSISQSIFVAGLGNMRFSILSFNKDLSSCLVKQRIRNFDSSRSFPFNINLDNAGEIIMDL